MKFLKIFGVFLLVVVAVVTLLAIFIPVEQEVQRSVMINASPSVIYSKLTKLENFNKWAVWNTRDSTVKQILTGKDGTVGASTSWKGDPDISGEGEITISSLQPSTNIEHTIHFTQPREATGRSEFKLEEVSGGTKLTWDFDLVTPRPWNIFNLFYNMDKKMGKDFEEGLLLIKSAMEVRNPTPPAKMYDVKTMNFPATRFLTVRQEIHRADMASFFAAHFPLILEETQKINATPGTPAGLFYNMNNLGGTVDIAAAITVPAETSIERVILTTTDIPASKAVFANYYGSYAGLEEVYNSLRKFLADNKLTQKAPGIERYIRGPANETDTAKWKTEVIFLVE